MTLFYGIHCDKFSSRLFQIIINPVQAHIFAGFIPYVPYSGGRGDAHSLDFSSLQILYNKKDVLFDWFTGRWQFVCTTDSCWHIWFDVIQYKGHINFLVKIDLVKHFTRYHSLLKKIEIFYMLRCSTSFNLSLRLFVLFFRSLITIELSSYVS